MKRTAGEEVVNKQKRYHLEKTSLVDAFKGTTQVGGRTSNVGGRTSVLAR